MPDYFFFLALATNKQITMKHILLVLAALWVPCFLFATDGNYSRVKIFFGDHDQRALYQAGIEVQVIGKNGDWAIAELSDEELARVSQLGFSCEVLIPDLEAWYADRYLHPENYETTETDRAVSEEWPVPANFQLGSCGGFSTIDQMLEQLDEMHTLYPGLITARMAVSDTSATCNGQVMYYVKISDNPGIDEEEPEVLYTGMHHAREPIAMQHLLFYMWYLLENYDSDPMIKALVDTTEMYFIPVVNVDGYAYNISSNPGGGGMWRKNRRLNQDGSFGIDINRNYGYMWGNDNQGSSPDPGNECFRGTAAFSEPETRMIKYFCEAHDFGIAINYHSYANKFLYAWGYTEDVTPDESLFNNLSRIMTEENNFIYGPSSTTIYITNGGSDDWMYGEQSTKNKMLAWTPEVGGDNDGFWPMQSRIIPLCQINMLQSLRAAQLVGNYAIVKDNSPVFVSKPSGYFSFNIKRYGLTNGNFTVTVAPLGSSIASVGDAKIFTGMQLLQSIDDSIAYTLDPLIMSGDTIRYALILDNGSFSIADTIVKFYGMPVAIVNDSLNTTGNWTGQWALTSLKYVSPSKSMTDSPSGNYSNNANRSTTTIVPVSLQNAMFAMLEFEAQWNLEAGYDYVQVKASTDDGLTWIPLTGQYTRPGTINQAAGEPLYDGIQSEWVKETIYLNDFLDQNVLFRFTLRSDGGVQADGYYFDDFKVSILLDPTKVEDKDEAVAGGLGTPFPNPADQEVNIPYVIPERCEAQILVYSQLGSLMSSLPANSCTGICKVNVHGWPKGVYLVKLESADFPATVKKLIVD